MPFAIFLLAIATPLVRRVLIGLGFGIISYAGLNLIAQQVKEQITVHYSTLSGPVLDLLNLIGFGQAIGIVIAAVIARVALAAVSKIGLMSQ